jgi:glycosyltransferase involved in cell wall biosynthesis
MKFSIITPSFNQGRFLADCVESVLSQTGVEVEHFIIDAGSTDETLEVLRRYPHLKWTSEPDAGMSDGINKGFLKATGDWLMWLNCDDYLLSGALVKVANYIAAHPEVDVVHGDCVFVREDRTPIRRKRDHPVDEFTLLFVGCFIPSTSAFYKREIVRRGLLLDTGYKVCMDWEYYLRLWRAGCRFGYLPEALAGFRWHGSNTSLVHLARGNEEGRKLQREHVAARGLCSWLGCAWVLVILRRVFQLWRVGRRFAVHGRFR